MPRGTGDNAFILFAKDLRSKKQNKGESVPEWDKFLKGMASAEWQNVNFAEKVLWKQVAKGQKQNQAEGEKPKKTVTRYLAGCDDEVLGNVYDEVELLDRMPVKRENDIKTMIERWTWAHSADRSDVKKKGFVFISCQAFCQKEKTDFTSKSEYYPAEISVVEFSIDEGITKTFHKIFSYAGNVIGDDLLTEYIEHGARFVHGISPTCTDEEGRQVHLAELEEFQGTMQEWRVESQNVIFCFKEEFLCVIGCLENIANQLEEDPLIITPLRQLVCIEDLLVAMLKWDHAFTISPDRVEDLHDLVKKNEMAKRKKHACQYHAQLEKRDDGERNEGGGREELFLCGLGMVKTMVEKMQEWVVKQEFDSYVVEQELEDTPTPSHPILCAEHDPTSKVLAYLTNKPLNSESFLNLTAEPGVEAGTSGSALPRDGGESSVENDLQVIRLRQEALSTYCCMNGSDDTKLAQDKSEPTRSTEAAPFRGHWGYFDSRPVPKNHGASGSMKENKFEGTSRMGSEGTQKTVQEGYALLASPTKPKPTKKYEHLTWNELQAVMPPGMRGLGRGFCMPDWRIVGEVMSKATVSYPDIKKIMRTRKRREMDAGKHRQK